MAHQVTCPSCQANLQLADEHLGKRVRCPKCKNPFEVEAPESTFSATPPARTPHFEPRRKSKNRDAAPAGKGMSPALIGAIVGGGGAVLVGAILLVVLLSGGEKTKPAPAPPPPGPAIAAVAPPKPLPVIKPVPQPVQPVQPLQPPIDVNQPLPARIGPDMVNRVKAGTVYLNVDSPTGRGEGSGFFAFERGLVVTNAHVLGMLRPNAPKPTSVEVVIHSGQAGKERRMPGTVLGIDRNADLAFVRVPPGDLPEPLLIDAQRPLFETQNVYIFGFPLGKSIGRDITVAESSISSLRKNAADRLEKVQVNGGMHPGNSGGPVVDAAGHVIGVSVAIIRNTSIHFAIPARTVSEFAGGRIQSVRHDEPVRKNGAMVLPIRVETMDPLSRVQSMSVDVWGDYSPDSEIRLADRKGATAKVRMGATRVGDRFELDAPIPALAPGMSVYYQPMMVSTEGFSQNFKSGHSDADPTPVESAPANLTAQLLAVPERTVSLRATSTLRLQSGKEEKRESETCRFRAFEKLAGRPNGAHVDIGFGQASLEIRDDDFNDDMTEERDGPFFSEFRKRPPAYLIDPTNKIRERSEVAWPLGKPSPQTRTLRRVTDMFLTAFETATIPVPNRQLNPKETWKANVPITLLSGRVPMMADLALDCTYEGKRTREGRAEAVITFVGRILSRGAMKAEVDGTVHGRGTFDLENGHWSRVQQTLTSEYALLAGLDLFVIWAMDVELTRFPGNRDNLVIPERRLTPQSGSGKLILTRATILGPSDPVDPPLEGGGGLRIPASPAKVFSVRMVAGKTYDITMNSGSIDAFLRLLSPRGVMLAFDDDSGGRLNSRIVFECPETGDYRIVARSLDGRMGDFTLNVHER